MSVYRVWQVKRGERVTGPFPESLILQHILLGRIVADDLISMDGHFWQSYRDTPEILEQIHHMMGNPEEPSLDPAWREERLRAILRHVDERKHLDPRSGEAQRDAAARANSRSGVERRKVPETVEQHSYRETTAEVDQWLQNRRPGKSPMAVILFCLVVAVAWALHHFGSQDLPVDIGLRIASCDAEPIRHVDWHGCDKSEYFLVGADLREANLVGGRFIGANLSYANLKGARLEGALFDHAKLAGAIWVDGRVCAADSIGSCR